jgi:hemerythrin superfamily protein
MAKTAKSKQKPRARKDATTTKRSTRGRVTSRRSRAQPSLGKRAVQALAGAANAVRALVPQLGPNDTATALLAQQHREVEASFATALGSEDARVRRNTTNEIVRQLTMHTDIEEAIFYPAVRGIDAEQAEEMVLEAYEEHGVVKMVLKQLPKVDPKGENFKAKMTVLKELVEHHVQEEEREMFPLAESQLGPERSRELAEKMAARAARA